MLPSVKGEAAFVCDFCRIAGTIPAFKAKIKFDKYVSLP
jgi:hypothetical protein